MALMIGIIVSVFAVIIVALVGAMIVYRKRQIDKENKQLQDEEKFEQNRLNNKGKIVPEPHETEDKEQLQNTVKIKAPSNINL